MGFDIRRTWKGPTTTRGANFSQSAVAVYTVRGTGSDIATEENAPYAIATSGDPLPNINDQYDLFRTDLRCNYLTGLSKGINIIEVRASYAYGSFVENALEVLSEPLIIGWTYSTTDEDTDHDIDGQPYQNLNGQIETGNKQTFFIDELKIKVNLSAYDWSLCLQYRNTVNATDIGVTTGGTTVVVPAGYMKCKDVYPTKEYRLDDAFIQAEVTLQIFDNNALPHPWQSRRPHVGTEAYVLDDGDEAPVKGRIVLADSGDPVSHDVLLGTDGIPFEFDDDAETLNYGVKRSFGKGVISTNFVPSPLASSILANLPLAPDITSSPNCIYLLQRKCLQLDFSGLFDALGIS